MAAAFAGLGVLLWDVLTAEDRDQRLFLKICALSRRSEL